MKTNDTAPRITHFTKDTGDSQSFSLTDSNFDPRTVARIPGMFESPVAGFKLNRVAMPVKVIVTGMLRRRWFTVEFNGRLVSVNSWSLATGGDIRLSTKLAAFAMAPEFRPMLAMLADLEQCAAVALARDARRAPAATTRA